MKLLAEWIMRAIILLLTAYLVPGFHIQSFTSALVVALFLGVLNLLVKPLLVLLTLPLTILTLGLFTFVINAILLMIVSSVVRGFSVESFGTALVAAIVIAILSSIFSLLIG